MTFFERIAWGAWCVCMLMMSIIVIVRPARSITHVYRDAAFHWWSSEPLYSSGIHGFLYLPTSAVLFTPFAYLPPPVGGMAWRWLAFALLTWAVWRLVRLALPEAFWRSALCFIFLAAIPASTVDLVRAQSEVIMVALMIHGAVDLGRGHWWRSTLALCLAVAIKPLALVMLLMAAVVEPAMRGRLAFGVTVMLAVPFAHPHPAYVVAQYQAMVTKMLVAVDPGAGRWNELGALLNHFGIALSESAMTLVRMAGAGGALALAWWARQRRGVVMGAVGLLALAICYQLLFNPRTEEGSYLNLAALAGLFGGIAWYVERRPRVAASLVGLGLGLGTHMYGDWIYRPTDLWLKPLLGVVFVLYLVYWIAAPLGASRGASASNVISQRTQPPLAVPA